MDNMLVTVDVVDSYFFVSPEVEIKATKKLFEKN